MSLLPHHKLDWNLGRLEKQLDAPDGDGVPGDVRLELAALCLSRAMFHDGGDPWYDRALQQVRRVLQDDPGNARGQAIAAAGLLGLERIEPALKHADEAVALDPELALAHFVRALWQQTARKADPEAAKTGKLEVAVAVREAEIACRLAPDAWEPHALLGLILWELGGSGRRTERAQYHVVRALELGPAPGQEAALLFVLGTAAVQSGKLEPASKLFTRLLEDERHRARAQFWLGVVNHQMGRFKNAVLSLRQHLDQEPENPRAHARLGMAYLQLGEIAKAREASNRALALDPADLQARWTLGCALAEEGREEDATRAFKAILAEAPDHGPAFEALVGLHRGRRDTGWLRAALRAEVKGFDRLPVELGGKAPRAAVRRRIEEILDALRELASPADEAAMGRAERSAAEDAVVTAVLEAMDLTTDEGLRFLLWETALDHVSAARARDLSARLQDPGSVFSAAAGREVLALARAIPEELLVRGLQIDEEDLRRAAVERHGPARDVGDHRKAIDAERREARAWQALLLLSIASHGNRSSRNLLVRWAAEADPDLGDAARAALVMLGDEEATTALSRRARARGAQNLLDAMVAQVAAPTSRPALRALAPGEDRACTTCGRRPAEVAHMMVGAAVAVCDRCLAEIAVHRRELETDDPESVCALSGRGRFETAAMYVFNGLTLCREVVDHGLGLLEREAVDRFLDQL